PRLEVGRLDERAAAGGDEAGETPPLVVGADIPESLLPSALARTRPGDYRSKHDEASGYLWICGSETCRGRASPRVRDNSDPGRACYVSDQVDSAGDLQSGTARVSERHSFELRLAHLRISVGAAVAQEVQGPHVVTACRQRFHPRAARDCRRRLRNREAIGGNRGGIGG